MAKIIITIEDVEDRVDIKFDFQPPAKKGLRTPAQEYAFLIASAISESRAAESVVVNGEEL